jgi:hypothetical protein
MKTKHRWITTALIGLLARCLMAQPDASGADDSALEPLRDPFWPVAYLPDGWKADRSDLSDQESFNGSDWDAPASMIRVSGTSSMGDQLVAIINGEIKEVGDLIQVKHNGRTYKWTLKGVKSNGKVTLQRVGISNPGIGF